MGVVVAPKASTVLDAGVHHLNDMFGHCGAGRVAVDIVDKDLAAFTVRTVKLRHQRVSRC